MLGYVASGALVLMLAVIGIWFLVLMLVVIWVWYLRHTYLESRTKSFRKHLAFRGYPDAMVSEKINAMVSEKINAIDSKTEALLVKLKIALSRWQESRNEIAGLGVFIIDNIPGERGGEERAVDAAMRLLGQYKGIADAALEARNKLKEDGDLGEAYRILDNALSDEPLVVPAQKESNG